MTWLDFYVGLNDFAVIVADIVRALPSIVRDIIFSFTGFSCVLVLVKMIREVRS